MATKLSSLTLSNKIPKWVRFNALVSSISYANHIQIALEADHNPPSSDEFEPNVRYLRNKLVPDNLIRFLDSTCDLDSAVKIFKWASLQRRFCHTTETYHRIILKLGMAGNVREMEGFCAEMVKMKFVDCEGVFVSLIDAFVKHNKLNEALRILAVMISGGHKPSIVIINVLMGALVEEQKEFKDVLFVYKEMVKAEIMPDVDTLNHLLKALLNSNRVDSALDQFRRMKKKGIDPNSRTFEVLINGLNMQKRVDSSINILSEMFDIGCAMNLSFYNTLIPSFCRENKPDEGLRLFKKMKDSKLTPCSSVYEVLIQCLCENLWLDDAAVILKDMIKHDLKPADSLFVKITNGYCKLGKFSEASKLLEEILVHEPSPYNALLENYCGADNFGQAKYFLETMLEKNVANGLSWNILIRWLCENGRIREGYELLGMMLISSFNPDHNTYSAVIFGNCKMDKYEDALKMFHQIRSKCWVLDSICFAELVEGLCREEMIEEAIEVFRYMSINNCSLRSSSFYMLINGVCAAGKVGEAITLRSLAYCSGTVCTADTYTTIMRELSKLNQTNNIPVVLSQMLVEGCASDEEAYDIVIRSMRAQNRTEECAMYFNSIVNKGLIPYLETVQIVLSFLSNHSQLHTILGGIYKIISDCDIFDSSMYSVVINGLWKEGFKDEARRLLDLMLEKGWVPDSVTHGLLVGSVVREEVNEQMLVTQDSKLHDIVDDILVDSLGKT